jgi:hypothetical protein
VRWTTSRACRGRTGWRQGTATNAGPARRWCLAASPSYYPVPRCHRRPQHAAARGAGARTARARGSAGAEQQHVAQPERQQRRSRSRSRRSRRSGRSRRLRLRAQSRSCSTERAVTSWALWLFLMRQPCELRTLGNGTEFQYDPQFVPQSSGGQSVGRENPVRMRHSQHARLRCGHGGRRRARGSQACKIKRRGDFILNF